MASMEEMIIRISKVLGIEKPSEEVSSADLPETLRGRFMEHSLIVIQTKILTIVF